ncbi:MAG: exodeoxyribonuclease VII small subunit [Bacteroidales bacterium]|nr:exodeoxyribonuclease VII small subunit [Candidatus Physcocola equi]
MEEKQLSYTESMEELEAILEKIENGEMDIDALSENVARASILIKACKEKLHKTNETVKELLDNLDK